MNNDHSTPDAGTTDASTSTDHPTGIVSATGESHGSAHTGEGQNPANVTATGDPNVDVQHAIMHPEVHGHQGVHHTQGDFRKVTNVEGDAVMNQGMVQRDPVLDTKPVDFQAQQKQTQEDAAEYTSITHRIEEEVGKTTKEVTKIKLGKKEIAQLAGHQKGMPEHQKIAVTQVATSHGNIAIEATEDDSHFSIE